MRHILLIIFFIGSIIVGGYYLEKASDFQPLKEDLQNLSIPSPHLNFGKRGQLMRKLGLEYEVPEDYLKYFDPETGQFNLKDLIKFDTVGRSTQNGWTSLRTVSFEKLPSSLVVNAEAISGDLPVLSIVIDKDDLFSAKKGIFTNAGGKGREWERNCYISYYDKGKLMIATGAGVRVHGGNQRRGPIKSLRFYFRDIYGKEGIDAGIFFDGERGRKLGRMILRKEPVFLNALAFDISERIGCIVPKTQPVRVYLNGEPYGPNYRFAITEHLSKSFMASNFGHDDFVLVRSKPEKVRRPREYEKLRDWANNTKERMTMAKAARYVDLENLSLWWISQIFTANTSIYQGLAFLDNKDPENKWFWVNWDMDNAFVNKNESGIEIWEQELILKKLMKNRYHRRPRALVFRRLMQEDPQYKKYFESLLTEKLNHVLTQDYLQSRTDYYQHIQTQIDSTSSLIKGIRDFIEHRHEFVFKLMHKYFESPGSYYCHVEGNKTMTYTVDGFPARAGYRGIYFKGASVQIRVDDPSLQKKIDHWRINGRKVKSRGNDLTYVIEANTTITPVFASL